VTETAHPLLPDKIAAQFQYGVFTARYGNIYTSRQLIHLFQRAFGLFVPHDDFWTKGNRYFDPFRPTIQPNGFRNLSELRRDREQHLAAVRRAIETLDVFIFTLGLTEAWTSAVDGAAYPVCPGVAAGEFDPAQHVFVNLSVDEVAVDLRAAIAFLRERNPRVRVILTVSPVPLMATARDTHVLAATIYSKSVLRVAAEAVCNDLPEVAYFPSYEIITGPQARGSYFADDLRSVSEDGVEHVMRLFFRHATSMDGQRLEPPAAAPKADTFAIEAKRVASVLCDEDLLAG
jgi:hypothetical protein